MKRNAIVRIVIWSFSILFLTSFLIVMLNKETDTTVPTIAWSSAEEGYGTEVSPPSVDPTIPEETLPTHSTDPAMWENPDPAANPDSLSYDPNTIRQMKIFWAAGDVRILKSNVERIIVSETEMDDSRYRMHIREKNGQLTIRYNQEDEDSVFFGIRNYPEKELTVLVPIDWYCKELKVEAASANVEVTGLTIGTMEFDGASGNCIFYETSIENLDMDTASGTISYYGMLNTLDCSAASADITAVLLNNPISIDVDTASGNLDLTLPVDCGFTVRMDGLSTRLESEFLTTEKNKLHLHGDGKTRIEMDSMSGDMILRIGKEESVPMN